MNLILKILDNNLVVGFTICIMLCCFWQIKSFLVNINPIIKQLRKASGVLGKIKTEDEFARSYSKLNDIFLNIPILKHAWYEFSESIVIQKDIIKNTKEASNYFNQETLLYGQINMSMYNSMPNILTGLGLIGTFLGLVSGVYQIDIHHINTIESLLSGAALAFITSLTGLISSIIYTVILRVRMFKLDRMIQKWASLLDSKMQWISAEKITYSLFIEQLKQSEIFESFAKRIGLNISDAITKGKDSQTTILEEIRDHFQDINLSNIEKIQSEQNDKILSGLSTLEQSIGAHEKQQSKVIQMTGAKTDKLLAKQLQAEFKLIEEIRDHFQDINLSNIEKIQSEQNDKILMSISALKQSIKAHEKQLSEVIQKTGAKTDNVLTKKLQTEFKLIENMNGNINKGILQIDKTITHSMTSLSKSFDDFKKHMEENYSRALIEALQDVIRDFNVKITEQFGDNFKELNKAVGKLLDWQDNYINIITETEKGLKLQFDRTKKSNDILAKQSTITKKISTDINKTEKSLSKLSLSTNDIEKQMSIFNDQHATLKEFLIAIKNIGKEAENVLPSISENIEEYVETLSKSVDGAVKKYGEMNNNLSKVTNEIILTMTAMVEEHSKQTDNTLEMLKQNLEKTLNDSLGSLAGHLAKVSNQFVKDYSPLTKRLRDVVTIAETIPLSKKIK